MLKWKCPWFLVLLYLFIQTGIAFAQERTIVGKVVESSTNSPVSGATVKLLDTDIQTVTAPDGTFELTDVPTGDLNVVVLAADFSTMMEKIPAGKNELVVELVSEESEEIVITGRATSMDKKHLAHSVSKVSGNDMTLVSAQSFSEALQGKVAGANIQSNSGAPGGGIQIKLRGVSTINANSAPLYVVDGVIMSNVGIPSGLSAVTASNVGSNTSTMQDNQVNRIADLNVNDIENIQILKGASAAAIYGAKASNGVVIITTKRGKPGQTEVSLSQRFGFYQISNTLGSRKYGSEQDVYDRFFDPENPDTISTAELAASQYRATNGRGYDHEDQLFGNSDLSSETNISIRSGTDVTDYYASLLTRKDAGTLVKTGHEKQSLRLNIGHAFSDKFQLRVFTNLIHSLTRRGATNNDNKNVSHYMVLATTPYFFNINAKNGLYPVNPYNSSGTNPLQTAMLMSDKEDLWRMVGSVQASLELYNDYEHRVQLNADAGVDRFQQKNNLYFPPELNFEPDDGLPGTSVSTSGESLNFNVGVNAIYTYEPDSDLFTSIASTGFQHEERALNILNVTSRFLIGDKSVVDAGKQIGIAEHRELIRDQGFYVQEEIILLDDSLTLTGAIRGERSSVNGDPEELFFYPKASVAYNLPWLPDFFDQIKFRFAYGETGNQPLYGQKFTPMNITTNIEGNPAIITSGIIGDPNIKPERQQEFEGGVDLIAFGNSAAMEFTIYQRNITDLLLQRNLAPSTGFTTEFFNGGELTNKGIEIALEVRPLDFLDNPDLEWLFRTTFALSRSEITSLPVPSFIFGGFGASVGAFRIEKGESATQIVGRTGIDENGNDIIEKLGDTEPTFRISFYNEVYYSGFKLSFLLDWQQGSNIINLTKLIYDSNLNSRDYIAHGQDRFFGEFVGNGNIRPYIEDATFLKLREVTLSYDLPEEWAAYLYASGATISLSGRNLLVISDYWGLDPEVSNFGNQAIARNVDVAPYPPYRSFWLSFDVRF